MPTEQGKKEENDNIGQEKNFHHFNSDSSAGEDVSFQWMGIRLLYTILFLIILAIVETIIRVTVLFQFIHLFFARKQNETVRKFSNQLAAYAYRVLRFVTMNEDQRPFPFADWPDELEPPSIESSKEISK